MRSGGRWKQLLEVKCGHKSGGKDSIHFWRKEESKKQWCIQKRSLNDCTSKTGYMFVVPFKKQIDNFTRINRENRNADAGRWEVIWCRFWAIFPNMKCWRSIEWMLTDMLLATTLTLVAMLRKRKKTLWYQLTLKVWEDWANHFPSLVSCKLREWS